MSIKGRRDLRHAAAAYFILGVGLLLGTATHGLLVGAPVSEWVLDAATRPVVPLVLGFGIHRRERWARWLGIRIGALGAFMVVLEPPIHLLRRGSDWADVVPYYVEQSPYIVAGLFAVFAAWRLLTRDARQELGLPRARSPKGADESASVPVSDAGTLSAVEVERRWGGTCTLTREPDAERPGVDAYRLELTEGVSPQRSRQTWLAAVLGGPPIALVLYTAHSVLAARNPTSVAAYMLGAALCWQVPLGAFLAWGLARLVYRLRTRPGFVAILGTSVRIDGEDVGRLVRVDSEAVERTVTLVAERAERRIELASENDAVELTAALGRVSASFRAR